VTIGGFLLVFLAATVAGAINSIAGGGTLLTFPAIVWLGVPPVAANATSTVALWPGSFGSMWAYRGELAGARGWITWFTAPSVAGSIAGALLLLNTSASRFDEIVPFLVLGATLLFVLQRPVSRWLSRLGAEFDERPDALPRPSWLFLAGQFAVAVYGGYFGAGIGILMLAAMGLIGMTDLHQMNGLKNLMAICINGIAAIYFAASGAVIWRDAVIMAAGAIIGGYLGARAARRMGRKFVRGFVVAIGLVMTVALLVAR
jgi:hypothetical protein